MRDTLWIAKNTAYMIELSHQVGMMDAEGVAEAEAKILSLRKAIKLRCGKAVLAAIDAESPPHDDIIKAEVRGV